MNKQKLKITLFSILLLASCFINASAQKPKELEITGTVVGFDLFSMAIELYEPSDSTVGRTVLVVRVDQLKKGTELSKYILVHYQYLHYQNRFLSEKLSRLEEKIFNGEKQWRIKLKRETRIKCDGKLRDIMTGESRTTDGKEPPRTERLTLSPGITKESLPLNTVLPCYATTYTYTIV